MANNSKSAQIVKNFKEGAKVKHRGDVLTVKRALRDQTEQATYYACVANDGTLSLIRRDKMKAA